jgi:hypothetical protein
VIISAVFILSLSGSTPTEGALAAQRRLSDAISKSDRAVMLSFIDPEFILTIDGKQVPASRDNFVKQTLTYRSARGMYREEGRNVRAVGNESGSVVKVSWERRWVETMKIKGEWFRGESSWHAEERIWRRSGKSWRLSKIVANGKGKPTETRYFPVKPKVPLSAPEPRA